MHWTSWYHCSKDTSVFLGVVSPLKVFIWGVPILNPAVSMLRSWPTSAVSWWGLTGHIIGSPCLHPSLFWDPLPHLSYSITADPRDPWVPWDDASRVHPPPSGPFWFGELLLLPAVDHHWDPRHPWLVLPVVWMPGPLTALCPGWACWGEARYPLPYPAHVFEHQRSCCSSWQHTLSPAHPLG